MALTFINDPGTTTAASSTITTLYHTLPLTATEAAGSYIPLTFSGAAPVTETQTAGFSKPPRTRRKKASRSQCFPQRFPQGIDSCPSVQPGDVITSAPLDLAPSDSSSERVATDRRSTRKGKARA